MHKTFNRDEEIDDLERQKLVTIMAAGEEQYTEHELSIVSGITRKFRQIKESQFTPIPSPDFRVKMGAAHVDGEKTATLKCELQVDLTVEEAAAYNFNLMSRKRRTINDRKDILVREVKYHNNHCYDNLLVKDVGIGFRARIFFSQNVWQRDGGQIAHVAASIPKSELIRTVSERSASRRRRETILINTLFLIVRRRTTYPFRWRTAL